MDTLGRLDAIAKGLQYQSLGNQLGSYARLMDIDRFNLADVINYRNARFHPGGLQILINRDLRIDEYRITEGAGYPNCKGMHHEVKNMENEDSQGQDQQNKESTKKFRTGGFRFSLVVLGIGILLASIGLPNEMRIRPYVSYSNCTEFTDEDGMWQKTCDTDPPEYDMFLLMAVVGFAFIGFGTTFFIIVYMWTKKAPEKVNQV